MSLFEFLMVLVSLIVGLGFAEILTGIAQQIRFRDSITAYWLHSCGVVIISFALLQNWWELWVLRDVAEWNFSGLVLMLIPAAGLYLVAHLIFPDPIQGADFKRYYHEEIYPIWWLGMIVTLASTLFKPLAFGHELLDPDNAASVVLIIGLITLATSKNVIVHSILVPMFLFLVIWDIFWWNPVAAVNG